MLVLFGLLAMFTDRTLQVANPTPIKPDAYRVDGLTVVYETDKWTCRIRAIQPDEMIRRLEGIGIEAGIMKQALPRLRSSLTFLVEFENRGADTLVFNPDQVLVRTKSGPNGRQLDMANFWPGNVPAENPEQVRFARLFKRGTVSLEPGRRHGQLAVFVPIDKRFKKKVSLVIDRLYYGIEALNIECQFEIRYAKP